MPASPGDPITRAAAADDAPALARLHVAAWRSAYRGLMPDRLLDALSVDTLGETWRRRLGAPGEGVRTWVADDGEVRGFVSAGPCRDEDRAGAGEVLELYVEPARVGQGLGRLLLARALDDLRARGLAEVVLWVLDGNARAERFYARAGLAPGRGEVKTVDGAPLPHTRWGMAL